MTHRGWTRRIVGRCFVMASGREYIGCVRVQRQEFYSTPRATYHDAVLEARKMALTLREHHLLTECECECLHSA